MKLSGKNPRGPTNKFKMIHKCFKKNFDIKKSLYDKISKQINKIKKISIRKCFKKYILDSK